MSALIKRLINDRQRAFHSRLVPQWNILKVLNEVALRKKDYYKNNVHHLKNEDCQKCWLVVNQMSDRPQGDRMLAFKNDARLLSDLGLANNLNEYYISANSDIPPLNMITLTTYLPAGVCGQLLAVNFSKPCVPDNIFCRIILKNLGNYLLNSICSLSFLHIRKLPQRGQESVMM